MRVTILVFGTRGEVQPLMALGLGLQAAGHTVRMVVQSDFYDFVQSYGLTAIPISLDLRSVDNTRNEEGNYPVWAVYKMARAFMRRALAEIWTACQDAEALILCDMAIVPGVHLVDKLQIPTFIACFYPDAEVEAFWRRGLAGKLAQLKQGLIFKTSMWLLTMPILREWRKTILQLPPRPRAEDKKEVYEMGFPVFYAYSPTVFPKPAEWGAQRHVTGYWFLPRPTEWQPAPALADFLAAGPPPVYVGFSSVSNLDMQKTTRLVCDALAIHQQRGILAAGWSNLGQQPALPATILPIEGAPHDWLFPHVAAAVHHGGAGTTGIALRTGTPNVIIPMTYDNPFWAWRVEDLGVGLPGIPHQQLTAERLATTLHTVIHDPAMQARRAALSAALSAEDGVAQAVAWFEHYVHR